MKPEGKDCLHCIYWDPRPTQVVNMGRCHLEPVSVEKNMDDFCSHCTNEWPLRGVE